MEERVRYLISYDIADDRRRRQVVKRLKRCAFRVQYSVFEGELSEARRSRLWRELCALIEPSEDGLLLVPACPGCARQRLEAGTTGFVAIDDDAVV